MVSCGELDVDDCEVETDVTVEYAIANIAEILARSKQGEVFTITEAGVPIAELLPIEVFTSTPAERRAAIDALLKRSKDIQLDGLKIKDLINEGRP